MGKDQRYSVGERGSVHWRNACTSCLGKGNGDPWISGKIKDDIEEFGYGVVLVRIKSDREPSIVDVQTAVIAKRGSAPTILVNSPVGDSQSNGRVENAIKKFRNLVKNNPFKFGIKVEHQSET